MSTDLAYDAWVVIANVSEGDWEKQTPEWQQAAYLRGVDLGPDLSAEERAVVLERVRDYAKRIGARVE